MPCSAIYFAITAFLLSGTFKYGLRFPAASSTLETSSLASRIYEKGISLFSGPFLSGKTTALVDNSPGEVFARFLKYSSSAIVNHKITEIDHVHSWQ